MARRIVIKLVPLCRIASTILAPVLLVFFWNSQEIQSFGILEEVYVIAGISGLILGILTFVTTNAEHPPCTFLCPWDVGGFIMSIVWLYIIANELMASLVAFDTILDLYPSLLALTMLSWGNSLGKYFGFISFAGVSWIQNEVFLNSDDFFWNTVVIIVVIKTFRLWKINCVIT